MATINGTVNNDTLTGGTDDDTLIGGLGDDTVDGGAGFNTYRILGTIDAFYWSFNANSQLLLTDTITDGVDATDGSDQGVDTLSNIQVLEFVNSDGSVGTQFQVDDYSNAVSASNYRIQYGVWVTGRANYYGDVDYFKLDTVAGQKVVLSGGSSSSSGELGTEGSQGSIQGNYAWFAGNHDRVMTFTTTKTENLRFTSSEQNANSPSASKAYSFIFRREKAGTDAADQLDAGNDFERLVGGLGDDTLNGSERADALLGGDGNDVLTGGAGNDELDGGAGRANVAIFSGDRADYLGTWSGGRDLSLRVADQVANRDGIDQLTNVQILRFADGDVVLDAESNSPTQSISLLGQALEGSLPIDPKGNWVDDDYFRLKLNSDISKDSALRISIKTPNSEGVNYWGNVNVSFYAQDSQDILTFERLDASGSITRFSAQLGPNNISSWIVSPQYWGSNSEFLSMVQWADVFVEGAARSSSDVPLGTLAGYTIQVDPVLYGTANNDVVDASWASQGWGVASYIDVQGGSDAVQGSDIDEQIIGGDGDDTLDGGAGNDTLVDSLGVNVLRGGDGDDTIDVSGSNGMEMVTTPAPTATVDGGVGIDTLRIANDTVWTNLSVTNVEVLDGGGNARTNLSPAELLAKGFTTAQGITLRLDPNLATGGTLDASGLSGDFDLRGTNQTDTLIGNSGDNTIYLNAQEAIGSGYAQDVVQAGAGDDTIVLATGGDYRAGTTIFSDVAPENPPYARTGIDYTNRSYVQKGSIDGGAGWDTLTIDFSHNWWSHNWAGDSVYYAKLKTPVWSLDLTGWTWASVEELKVVTSNEVWTSPTYLMMSATQLGSLQAASGLESIQLKGGGAIDLTHFKSLGVGSWQIGDEASYTITGSANSDQVDVSTGVMDVHLGAGNDTLVIDSKPLVTDVLDGGAGIDTLVVRGSDVDLSGATLADIESIQVSSQSLSMTEQQWTDLGAQVSRVQGANTGFILSITTPSTTTLASDSPYVGLTGSGGDDILTGNASDNILVGGTGNDALNGQGGNDRLVSGAGVDTLSGGEGNDTLVVTGKVTVRDQLSGGAGVDVLQVSDGQDLTAANISGVEVLKGSGTVTLSAAQLAGFQEVQGVSVQLNGGANSFVLGAVALTSGAQVRLPDADTTVVMSQAGVWGSKSDDTIVGGSGHDLIMGGRGSDWLSGGAGNDTLVGGSGADTLSGDAGDDQFLVDSSEFNGNSWLPVVIDGPRGDSVRFDSKNRVVYADAVHGGEGLDTLKVDFGNSYNSAFVITSGAVQDVEQLDVSFTSGGGLIVMNATTFQHLQSISTNDGVANDSRYDHLSLGIVGNGNDLSLQAVDSNAQLRVIWLQGVFHDVDTTGFSIGPSVWNGSDNSYSIDGSHVRVSAFDSLTMSDGNDGLIVEGDREFSVNAGAGDDIVRLNVQGKVVANIDGGGGDDVLDLTQAWFIDLSASTISGFETIRHGSSTLVVTQAQADALSFDGSGAKYTKSGSIIVGTDNADTYSGDGSEHFQGGKGDDSISYVNTAVFTGNLGDYSYDAANRNGNSFQIEQTLGAQTDGIDTLAGVMNLQFADITVAIDDAPDGDQQWTYLQNPGLWDQLIHADYSKDQEKKVSGKKDYANDSDLFAATLVPNSPLYLEGSTTKGSGWNMQFWDMATGQQLQFKSLVHGSVSGGWWSSWMDASGKWLPGFNTGNSFQAYQGGDVLMRMQVDGNEIQDYAFSLHYQDDYAGSVQTLGQMDAQTGVIRGYIGEANDADWIRTDLIAGTKYEFQLKGLSSGGGSLVDPKLTLRDDQGRLIEEGVAVATDDNGNPIAAGSDDAVVFRPTASGTYYLAVTDVANINQGSWTLTQQSLDMIPGNASSSERAEWSGANTFSINSEINVLSDHDWFKVWLDNGITYKFRALGESAGGTLADPQLSIRSVTGVLLGQNDNAEGSDAVLNFSAPDSGWYFLDVGASGNASKGTYFLKGSTLADDFSNDVHTTGVVQLGTPLQGLVSYINDSDWVQVGLSKGVTYVIDLVGDISDSAQLDPLSDPLLTLRDDQGNFIARFDDFGSSLNARAYFMPTDDGAYFLEAKSTFKYDIGAYRLSVDLAPADDFAADFSPAAQALSLGVAQKGELGIPGDRDVFQIGLEADKVYQLSLDGLAGHGGTLADPYLRVFDAQGRLLDFDNNGGAGNDAELYLAPSTTGVFYVEASSQHDRGMGSYSLNVVQRDLPADDVPNGMNTTVLLNPGDSFSGQLLTHHDQDWFKIKLNAGEDYVFSLQAARSGQGSLQDPYLELRAADSTLIDAKDNMLFGNEPSLTFTPIATGTYHLVAKAADGQTDTGSYTLVTRAPDDHGNTRLDATALALNQSLDGGIQWSSGAFGVRAVDSIGLATDIDEDWFSFTANAGDVLSVQVKLDTGSSLSRPMVEVLSSSMLPLAVGDGLETDDGLAVASFVANTSGQYFARVIDGAGATGTYTIGLMAGDASDEDSQGPVALDFANVGELSLAQTQARIGLAGDTDSFTVNLASGHSYRIETLPVRDGNHAPLPSATLELSWLAQGESSPAAVELTREVANPSFYDSSLFTADSSGLMTITVAPLEGSQTGQYGLRVVDLGASAADDRPDSALDYGAGGIWAVNESASGRIDSAEDIDLFAINLTAGKLYDFAVKGFSDGLGTLAQSELKLLDIDGHLVTAGSFDAVTGRTQLPVSVFETGRYFLAVSATDSAGNLGTYVLDTRERGSDEAYDDLSADTRSGMSVGPGKPVTGSIDYAADQDWVKTTLKAGHAYVLDVLAGGDGAGGTLSDATLRLLDASGAVLAQDDNSGAGLDAHIQFTALSDADYYLDVGSNGGATGSYTLRVRELYSGEADPMKSAQWYLSAIGLDGLNGQITGAGVTVGMVDDGIDTVHPDLQQQINLPLSYDTVYNTQDGSNKIPFPTSPFGDFHGTAVAGLIVAEQNNETGIVGVAPDADIASVRVKWTWDQITEALGKQVAFDVSNNSWGAIDPFADNFNSTNLTFAWQALRNGVEDGRDGLGTVFVFSAGNSSGFGDNTNYHNFQNAREAITVAATNADGSAASFSTPGASVLVGTYGVDLLTTDRHEKGLGLDLASNYTSFTGTSAAAPLVSGVVALMLEANPSLGYRDVQEILAYSATHPEVQDWKANGAADFNLGGLRFNDQVGFGLVDAHAAVRLAETWTEQNTAINEVRASAREFGMNELIPDGTGERFTKTFSIDSGMTVEQLELGVDLKHSRLGDVIITVTSPSGTVSTLMDRPTVNAEQPFGLSGADSGVPTHLLWDFSSVQFWGEEAAGDWTISIEDVRAEQTGSLKSLSLRLYGQMQSADDVYVFSDEGFTQPSAQVLADDAGVDTINAVMVSFDTYANLADERVLAANGVVYAIEDWTVIEHTVTGSGDDRLVGNDANNRLQAMEGDDTLEGGMGNDTLIGGSGSDTAVYAGKLAEFGRSWNPDTKTLTVTDNVLTGGDEGTDTLVGIERLVFSDGEFNLSETVGNAAPVANVSFFAEPVVVGAGMGIDFDIPDDAFSDADADAGGTPPVLSVADAAGAELPDWLSFDEATGQLTGVPPEDFKGQLKLLVSATDEFGASASDVLTLQFGDNQAPVVQGASELLIDEDAGLVAMGITAPSDPEGKAVSVTIEEVPGRGVVRDKSGQVVGAGDTMSADELSELHYRPDDDDNGAMGKLVYTAVDDDGVQASGSVSVFVSAVNDAPRFSLPNGQLSIAYPVSSPAPLDFATPSDPESAIDSVTVSGLPALGSVWLGAAVLALGQTLTLTELQQLSFTLAENVRGPIGAVSVTATDEQGLSTEWSLNLEITGDDIASTGGLGADQLYGSIGDDILYGLAGDDLVVGNAGDDRLLGGLGSDTLFGGAGQDTLDGSSGNDWLDGGSGNDQMAGGPGADTYFVDSTSDLVLEVIGGGAGGKDLVVTQVSLTAPSNVEELQAADGWAVDLTGNALDNVLLGNDEANTLLGQAGLDILFGGAGNDTLDGGEGVDKMLGGDGDDEYHVNSRLDVIRENADEGVDTVWAASHYTLPSNLENLFLDEGGDWAIAGNSLDNHLVGNAGNNVLAGGLGADTLEGGLGDDIYVLNDQSDVLIDTGGVDTIRTSLNTTLADGFEHLILVGITDAEGVGNAADNQLTGNVGDNILDGRGGVDTMTGGGGSDQFVLSQNANGLGPDQITDFSSGEDLMVVDLLSFGVDIITLGLPSSGKVQADSFVKGAGAKAIDPNDHFIFDTAMGVLRFDVDGSGAQAAVDVVKLVGVIDANLNGNDIYVAV